MEFSQTTNDQFKPTTKEELKNAVNLWCVDRESALKKYGDISIWDTSLITDMAHLFEDKNEFNDPINDWDVSNVTDMMYMFTHATKFNQPLDKWNTSKVDDMSSMFASAHAFNQPPYDWDIDTTKTAITNMFGEDDESSEKNALYFYISA